MVAEAQQLQPDSEQIRAQLEYLTRRWPEFDQPLMLEIVFLTNDDKAVVKNVARFDPSNLDFAVDHITGMNPHKLNAYVTVNPVDATHEPASGKRASREHIAGSLFHWADADSEEAAENIRSFVGPKCTMHVLTGTQPCKRPHVYWELEDPTRNMDAWEKTQRAIASTLKTDPSVVDPPRIMRVAGTINWPKPQKQAKGYVPELTTLRIYEGDERHPVTSERMARAFHVKEEPAADWIDGEDYERKTSTQYADALKRARTDGEKHTGVRDLSASLAGAGVPEALAKAIIREACPVWDSGVEGLIRSAYRKFYKNPEALPEQVTPQAISDFRIDSGDDFLADLEPLEYLIDGLLPRGVTYSLTGHAGHGKTTLALQFALSVALGEDFAGRAVSSGDVLILAGENPYNVKWQYAAALAARNIKASGAPIHFVQGRFSINQFGDVLRAKMDEMPNLKLVIVDSLQAFFEGDNDNDNTQMVEMAHKVRNMANTSTRPAMLIIAHPAGKIPSKDNLVPRGGGAFLNEIDGNLTVWSGDSSQQTLHHSQKFRGAGFDPVEFVMQIHEFSHLTDINGVPLKLPVSRPEVGAERADREQRSEQLLRRFLEALERGTNLSLRDMASQFGITRYRAETIIATARDEKLIKRYAKKWTLTDGGREFLDD